MNIRTFFAVVRLMFDILFRRTPIQTVKQSEPERKTRIGASNNDEGVQEHNVTPIGTAATPQPANTSTEEHSSKAA